MKPLYLLSISTLLVATQVTAARYHVDEEWIADADAQDVTLSSPVSREELPPASNQPVNPWASHSNLLWVRAEALIWQAVEDNLQYAYTRRNLPPTSQNVFSRDIEQPDFDWDWGYRVGVGYQLPYDGWDTQLLYTHMENHASGKLDGVDYDDPKGQTLFIYQVWGQEGTQIANNIVTSSAHWRIHLDQLDLNLGRDYYVGKHVTLRPNAGLRATWLFQKYDVTYANQFSVSQDIDLKNRFWGIGFVGGFDCDWLLGSGFSLYGGADYSILLGFFDVDQKNHQEGSEVWKTDKSFRSGKSIIDMELGIKWNYLFPSNAWGITLKAGYEYHLYFNQNQFVSQQGVSDFNLYRPNGGNLIYQGVTLSGQLNF